MDESGAGDPRLTGQPSGSGGALSDHGPRTTDHDVPDDAPPFGLSWRTLYGIVAATLAVLIALFSLFTRAFE